MKAMHELKETLCKELDKIATKRDMTAGDLEMAHKLTDTIKNIDKIMMLEEDEGYTEAGNWRANIEGGYGDRHSYARRRDSMGRYTRDGEDYSMHGYSRGHDLVSQLEEKMRHAKSDRDMDTIRRCVDVLREG